MNLARWTQSAINFANKFSNSKPKCWKRISAKRNSKRQMTCCKWSSSSCCKIIAMSKFKILWEMYSFGWVRSKTIMNYSWKIRNWSMSLACLSMINRIMTILWWKMCSKRSPEKLNCLNPREKGWSRISDLLKKVLMIISNSLHLFKTSSNKTIKHLMRDQTLSSATSRMSWRPSSSKPDTLKLIRAPSKKEIILRSISERRIHKWKSDCKIPHLRMMAILQLLIKIWDLS